MAAGAALGAPGCGPRFAVFPDAPEAGKAAVRGGEKILIFSEKNH
jgi:hypothetical protein